MITLTQQIKAVRKAKPIGPRHANALKAAASTIASLNIIIGDPGKFKSELEFFLKNREEDRTTLTQDVIGFLKSKGLAL